MGLKLNRISDEVALRELPSTEQRVLRLRVLRDKNPDPKRHYHLGKITRNLALEYYQQERSVDEIVDLLVESAEATLKSWELRTENQGGGFVDGVCWSQMISPVLAFGPTTNRARLVAIPDAVIYENGPEGSSAALLIAAMRYWLKTGDLGSAHASALDRYSRDDATRRECKVLLPTVQGLAALHNRNADVWNASLAATTADHKRDAMRGELQRDPRGYMNLEGVWLLRLGLERGMACTVDSPYLPLFVLEAICKRFASSS